MLLSHVIIFSVLATTSDFAPRNNVCKTFQDYYYPDQNPNCYYDPDTILETTQLIQKYSGRVEIYNVTTEDGYILRLFRIPQKSYKRKGVILLHHSIATYSHIYLWEGDQSLAMTLWRNGYDVWLANQRGTFYSNHHVNMSFHNFKYWDFSFHEMALYDITPELKLIRSYTNNSKIIFFGHSLGSTIGLTYATLKPSEAKHYLRSMILVAPAAFFKHPESIIFIFAGLIDIIKTLSNSLEIGSILFSLPAILPISRVILRLFPFLLFLASMLLWALCGYTPDETNPNFFNFDAAFYGDDFSIKTLIHFGQIVNSNRFQMYDYGAKENLKTYNQTIPPLYSLTDIQVPTLLISSYNDSLIALKDCETIYAQLPLDVRIDHWKLYGLNHLDYHIGLHRKEIFVDRLFDYLRII